MLLYFFDHCIMKTGSESPYGRLCPERVLTSRLRGDDKPFITVTPAQAGVQNYLNMKIVYNHIS